MRFLAAVVVSLLAHGLIALAIAWWMGHSEDRTLARLDLSSVELSFAEEEDSAAEAVASSPPAPPPEPEPPRELPPPEAEPPPPEQAEIDDPAFAEPETARRPLPEATAVEEPMPAAAVAPRQAKVDAPPRPRRAIRPDYPAEARRRGIEGETVLELKVAASGKVEGVEVVESSGHPVLDAAAVRAVKAAEFVPAKAGGEAVESPARIRLVFRLK